MPDIVDPETRSRMMAGIRGKNTKPELAIRKELHRAGFRYRLHPKDVPGKPDIVLPRYRSVIFVNGCFWHGHDCELFRLPGTRREFWETKISRNMERDREVRDELGKSGWRHMTVWECAIRGTRQIGLEATVERLIHWLRDGDVSHEEIRAVRGSL